MSVTLSFTSKDQIDGEGKVVDKIFLIKEVETVEYEKEQTLSGTEVAEKIKRLEELVLIDEKNILKLQTEINFLKTLK